MGLFNLFRRKKQKDESIDKEYEKMFGNDLDSLASHKFSVDLNRKYSSENEEFIKNLLENDIPETPQHALQKDDYAMKMYKKGDIDKSIYLFKQSIELGNLSPSVFNRLAIAYRKKKDYQSEYEILEQAIDYFEEKPIASTSLRDFNIRKKRVLELMRK